MTNNGFTLVELLAVITILSLVALVATISVANLVKNTRCAAKVILQTHYKRL